MTAVRDNIVSFLFISVLLLIAYEPVITGNFVFNDDAYMWAMDGSDCTTHPQHYYFFYIGRVSFTFLGCLMWSSVETLGDLSAGRLINVLFFGISAFLFSRWLCKNSVGLIHSILLSSSLFSLPAFQTQVVLVNSFPHTIGLLAAVLSFLAADRGAERVHSSQGTIFGVYTFFSTALLFFSMTIYTPLAMFYWVLLAVPLIHEFDSKASGMRKWFYLFALPFVASAMFFIFSKCMYAFLPFIKPQWVDAAMPVVGNHRVLLTHDVAAKVMLFIKAMWGASGLWNIFLSVKFSLIICALSFLMLHIIINNNSIREGKNHNSPIKGVLSFIMENYIKILMILSLFPLSLLPNLVADYNRISFRMIAPLSALTLTVLFFLLKRSCTIVFKKNTGIIVTTVLVANLCVSIYKARDYSGDFIVKPAAIELEYLKSILPRNGFENIEEVIITGPPFTSIAPRGAIMMDRDEYGFLTSSVDTHVKGLLKSAERECHEGAAGCGYNVDKALSKGRLIIDRNEIAHAINDAFLDSD